MKRGLIFGCFDPFHAGHVRLFRFAKEHCDHLTVLVHSDAYIRKYKHHEPCFPEADRVSDVSSCRPVDVVMINPDRDRNAWIHELHIDILFCSVEVPGTGFDCEVIRVPRTPNVSSSRLR